MNGFFFLLLIIIFRFRAPGFHYCFKKPNKNIAFCIVVKTMLKQARERTKNCPLALVKDKSVYILLDLFIKFKLVVMP